MNEIQLELEQLKESLKALTSKKLAERTPEDKMKMAEIRFQIAQCKAQIEKNRFETMKAKAVEAKERAILKNLHEHGIDTENTVKGLLKLREVCFSFDIKKSSELRAILVSAKERIPDVFSKELGMNSIQDDSANIEK